MTYSYPTSAYHEVSRYANVTAGLSSPLVGFLSTCFSSHWLGRLPFTSEAYQYLDQTVQMETTRLLLPRSADGWNKNVRQASGQIKVQMDGWDE